MDLISMESEALSLKSQKDRLRRQNAELRKQLQELQAQENQAHHEYKQMEVFYKSEGAGAERLKVNLRMLTEIKPLVEENCKELQKRVLRAQARLKVDKEQNNEKYEKLLMQWESYEAVYNTYPGVATRNDLYNSVQYHTICKNKLERDKQENIKKLEQLQKIQGRMGEILKKKYKILYARNKSKETEMADLQIKIENTTTEVAAMQKLCQEQENLAALEEERVKQFKIIQTEEALPPAGNPVPQKISEIYNLHVLLLPSFEELESNNLEENETSEDGLCCAVPNIKIGTPQMNLLPSLKKSHPVEDQATNISKPSSPQAHNFHNLKSSLNQEAMVGEPLAQNSEQTETEWTEEIIRKRPRLEKKVVTTYFLPKGNLTNTSPFLPNLTQIHEKASEVIPPTEPDVIDALGEWGEENPDAEMGEIAETILNRTGENEETGSSNNDDQELVRSQSPTQSNFEAIQTKQSLPNNSLNDHPLGSSPSHNITPSDRSDEDIGYNDDLTYDIPASPEFFCSPPSAQSPLPGLAPLQETDVASTSAENAGNKEKQYSFMNINFGSKKGDLTLTNIFSRSSDQENNDNCFSSFKSDHNKTHTFSFF